MSTSTPFSWQQGKREFYNQSEVIRLYDRQRFGGPSGARVNARELALVISLLPEAGRVLDLGCGTGRLGAHLHAHGYRVVALDTSADMLGLTRARADVLAVQADGFALPFRPGAFDAVVALRVAFHYRDLRALLTAAVGVLAPGGTIVFDTCSWSPRAFAALGAKSWGGKVWVHRPTEVRRIAGDLGLVPKGQVGCFLLSPYVYRLLPLPVVIALERLERVVPSSFLVRTFWQMRVPRDLAKAAGAMPGGPRYTGHE